MSLYRKNVITNDWVIFAPGRAKRPVEYKAGEVNLFEALKDRLPYKKDCPFCRGNENPEDKLVMESPGPDGWQIRILENKFASVDRNLFPEKKRKGLFKEMEGFGIHDVIIDHPSHNTILALMKEEEIFLLLKTYLARYQQIQSDERIEHVVIFKNQGFSAGGSLEHSHSQIYGLPLVPFETQTRLHEVRKYYEYNDTCLMCNILESELGLKERIIAENECFLALSPFAALSPYHIWIVPKKHSPSFAVVSEPELIGLSQIMKKIFYKLFFGLSNPDFNYVFQSLACADREQDYFHWYISIIPQLKRRGGIEYAGGLFVNTVLPEKAAEDLRGVPEGQSFSFKSES
jgi:UDPglucose--hexose-1-phosphate uridylyltransferase